MLGLAILSGFIIPLDLGFKPEFLNTSFAKFVNWVIDLIFFIDLILGFFTAYVDKKGKEEMDSKLIFEHYTGKFVFYTDLLSICGNSILQELIVP